MGSKIQKVNLSLKKKITFTAVIVMILLVLGELGSHWYLKNYKGYDGVHLMVHEFDAYKNILPARNYVDTRGIRHNSQGFRRSTEVPLEKPSGTYRIFLMGGSTAYGYGGKWTHIQKDFEVIKNSETIDAHLESYMSNAIEGKKIEVINAAISSTWTHHHLIYLNQTILRYQPDMVIFLDGRNDYFEHGAKHDQFASYAYGEQSHEIMGPPTLRSLVHANIFWLYRRSTLAYLTLRGTRRIWQSWNSKTEKSPMDVDKAIAELEDSFPANALKMNERIALLLQNEGVSAVFVLQPLLILERDRTGMPPIEREMFEYFIKVRRENSEEFYHRAVSIIRKRQRETVENYGATFIDATVIYRDSTDQIFTDYCHLTPRGNEILAQNVAEIILPDIQASIENE